MVGLNLKNVMLSLAAAPVVAVDLRPGDSLYVPPLWWHTVETLPPSLQAHLDEAEATEVWCRRLQTAVSVTYPIVYDPDGVAISVDTIAETVTAAAEEAIDEGSFIEALDTAMAEVLTELVAEGTAINPETGAVYDTDDIADVTALFIGSVVITEAVVTILSTEAPTFWSDTEENMEPVIVSRRQGGVAVSELPACGCDDDTTA